LNLTVGLEATKRCNFKCAHCFVDAGRPAADEMGTAEMRDLLDAMADFGVRIVAWSGGEPLLRPDLEALTAHGARRGINFSLATNGYLADRERLDALRRVGLYLTQVSLDAASPERARRFRRGPRYAFEKAVAAVEASVALGLSTYVCTLMAPETVDEIEEMIALARGLGARGLRYTMWAPVGRAAGAAYDEAAWSTPALAHFLEVAERHAWGEDGFQVIIDCPTGPLPSRPRFRCNAGREAVYILATGEVYPCTALMTPDYLVGNVRERPLAQLLTSAPLLKIHRQLAASEPRGACATCGLVESCRGGCPGRTLAAFGSVRRGPGRGAMPACLLRLHAPRPRATVPRRSARRSKP